jgi:hypothetical protein
MRENGEAMCLRKIVTHETVRNGKLLGTEPTLRYSTGHAELAYDSVKKPLFTSDGLRLGLQNCTGPTAPIQ